MFQKKVKGNVHLPNFFFVFESCDVEYCYRFCVGFLWKWNDDNTERFYCFKFPIECGIIFATLEWWKATITNEWIHIVHISIHKQQCVYCVFFSLSAHFQWNSPLWWKFLCRFAGWKSLLLAFVFNVPPIHGLNESRKLKQFNQTCVTFPFGFWTYATLGFFSLS